MQGQSYMLLSSRTCLALSHVRQSQFGGYCGIGAMHRPCAQVLEPELYVQGGLGF